MRQEGSSSCVLTCVCICSGVGGVTDLMSFIIISSSVMVGLCDLLTSRLPNRTIPAI